MESNSDGEEVYFSCTTDNNCRVTLPLIYGVGRSIFPWPAAMTTLVEPTDRNWDPFHLWTKRTRHDLQRKISIKTMN